MEQNKKLMELLGRDRESRDFFASLSPELRRLLMQRDIGNFEVLRRAAAECDGLLPGAPKEVASPQAASGTELTGAVPRGDDLTHGEWATYQSLSGTGADI